MYIAAYQEQQGFWLLVYNIITRRGSSTKLAASGTIPCNDNSIKIGKSHFLIPLKYISSAVMVNEDLVQHTETTTKKRSGVSETTTRGTEEETEETFWLNTRE